LSIIPLEATIMSVELITMTEEGNVGVSLGTYAFDTEPVPGDIVSDSLFGENYRVLAGAKSAFYVESRQVGKPATRLYVTKLGKGRIHSISRNIVPPADIDEAD
jgi:hypothetical protein